jgi:hypothetical protein
MTEKQIPFLRRIWDAIWPIPRDAWHCPKCLGQLRGGGNRCIDGTTYWIDCGECFYSTAHHNAPHKCENEVRQQHGQ